MSSSLARMSSCSVCGIAFCKKIQGVWDKGAWRGKARCARVDKRGRHCCVLFVLGVNCAPHLELGQALVSVLDALIHCISHSVILSELGESLVVFSNCAAARLWWGVWCLMILRPTFVGEPSPPRLSKPYLELLDLLQNLLFLCEADSAAHQHRFQALDLRAMLIGGDAAAWHINPTPPSTHHNTCSSIFSTVVCFIRSFMVFTWARIVSRLLLMASNSDRAAFF